MGPGFRASTAQRRSAWASALRCDGCAATNGQHIHPPAGEDTSYSWYFVLARMLSVADGRAVRTGCQPMKFLRRLGPDPHANGAQTVALNGCPDIFELASGDFAIIGIDITASSEKHLPPSAGCGPDERIVLIPRKTLVLAKQDIPDEI